VEWVPIEKLASHMENTHASILGDVDAGVNDLHETKNV